MFRWLVILLLCWSKSALADQSPATPSLESFIAPPLIESMQLSPSGRHVAVLRHHEGRSLLMTLTVAGEEPQALVRTEDGEGRIAWFVWVNDERVLVSLQPGGILGSAESKSRLLAINRDGTQRESLLEHSSFLSALAQTNLPRSQDEVVGVYPRDPRHVLMELALDRPLAPDVYKVDVYSGKRTMVQHNPGGTTGGEKVLEWIADRDGQIRVGIGQSKSMLRVIVKPPGSVNWQEFAHYDMAKETGPVPLGFDADPTWLYVRDLHRGRASVFKINLVDPSAERKLIATDPKSDLLGELVYATSSKRAIGVRYGREDRRVLFWDFDAQRLQARIDRALVGRTNIIESSSHDGRLHIVKSGGSAHPPTYVLFDERDGTITNMGDPYPQLATWQPVEPESVTIIARDGKELLATLTMIRRREARPVPLIVFPGGQFGPRDSTGFNPWTQWFVAQGWAVLQINFRDVMGFGDDFLRGGFQRWGLESSDDLSDGVRWAIRQGFADSARVCSVGANYGAYAALMAAVREPDLYRCVASLGAVTDLLRLLEDDRWYLNRKDVSESRMATWWGDPEQLQNTSPIVHAGELRAPVLLLHGAEDQLVPASHSRDLANAMKQAGLSSFRYVELPQTDQRLNVVQDRVKVSRELDRFLHQYLDEAQPAAF
jgi:dipeptidyl aminopeptidase/acylaminoacyl peptidase